MTATHFVVSRLNWKPVQRGCGFVRAPGETRVGVFSDFRAARTEADTLEALARNQVNPFRCGATWSDRSVLPEPVFRDFLRDAGIEPPTDGDWADWWSASDSLTDLQRNRVWEGLDRLRFYLIEEQPLRPIVFAVVRIEWNYNDMWYYPGPEGGEMAVAYRTRERAEAECQRLNREARAQWRNDLDLPPRGAETDPEADADELYQFDMENRRFPGESPFEPRKVPPSRRQEDVNEALFTVDEVPFYEVVEFELGENG